MDFSQCARAQLALGALNMRMMKLSMPADGTTLRNNRNFGTSR